ncbi:uncharacterized protein LOC141595072 [Silene latifolia]|uniref:uncharacterized protein LOC141595072 n=1 Tax=Silene latifolia TaxID=37657 RepID=UPI003D788080
MSIETGLMQFMKQYEDAIEKKVEDEKVNNAKDIKSPLKWDPMILFEDIFSKMFEFRGILCRHIMKCLDVLDVKAIPDKYILDRWRKDLVRGYENIRVGYYNPDESERVKSSLNNRVQAVPQLDGTNYSEWKEHLEFYLGILELDQVLNGCSVNHLTDASKEVLEEYNWWKKSDSLCLKFLRLTTAPNIKSSISETVVTHSPSKYMEIIKERFRITDKAVAGRLMSELTTAKYNESAHHVHHVSGKSKGKFGNRKGMKSGPSDKLSGSGIKKDIKKQESCFFCKKPGHFQNDCIKRKNCFEKKGKPLALGFLTTRNINPNEASLYMGNKDKASVEAIGRFSLELSTGFKLKLEDTLYVPSFGRNLISVSKLDNDGFKLSFGQGCFSMFRDNIFVGSGILENGLYRIYLDKLFSESLCVSHNVSLHNNVSSKRGRSNESSSFLWHKRLAHISRERISILVKDNILPSLDFTNFGTCVECIKEVYIKEVERQLGKKVKIVRSDRGGEYYGKYDESGQHPGPFAKLLESLGIVPQYTTHGSPWMNGVAERRNLTLLEAVRTMMSNTNLPMKLWMHALMTAVYVGNRVPSKAVSKTPFELWKGWKPRLQHLHVWGCPAEARIYNPHERKLDPRTISGFFIGYPEKSKGYRFYCPTHKTRIVETGNAKFLENGEVSGSDQVRDVVVNKVRVAIPVPLPPISIDEVPHNDNVDSVNIVEPNVDDPPLPNDNIATEVVDTKT